MNNKKLYTKTASIYYKLARKHTTIVYSTPLTFKITGSSLIPITTPLIDAAQAGDITQVRALLKAGAEVNAKDERGKTALHVAAQYGHAEIVLVLIEKGAKVNIENIWRETALHVAAQYGHAEIVLALIEKGAGVNAKNKWGGTPLHLAAKLGHTEIVLALIEKWAKVNSKDNSGETALHDAARYGHTETILALIKKGAEVNCKGISGETALHDAARDGHTETILALIEKGADVNVINNAYQSPLEYYLNIIRIKFSEDSISANAELPAMQNMVRRFLAEGADMDYALKRLKLTDYRRQILNGNLFAGLNANDDAITQFINRAQNTHDPLVTKTIEASMRVLRDRYGSSLDMQATEEEILSQAQNICDSPNFIEELSLNLAKQKILTPQEQTLVDLLKEPNPGLHLMGIVKQFLQRLNEASQSKIHQSAHLLWVALHDSQHRYRTINTVEKDIQEAEISFMCETLKADNCTEGGLFHPMVALCCSLGIPGIYVHRLLTERMTISRDSLLNRLDPVTAFNWAPREAILSDDSAYTTFIDTFRYNHELYKTHGQTQVLYFGEKEEILSEDELREFEQRLCWTQEKYRAVIQEKGVEIPQSPHEEQVKQLESWAETLNSLTPGTAWSLMSDYYTQQIQMVERREITREALEAQMRADHAMLATRCPTQNIPGEDGVNYLETFFDDKQSQLNELVLISTPPVAFQPPSAPSQEEIRRLTANAAEQRKLNP